VAKLSSQNSDTINLLKTPDDQKWTIFLEKIMDKIILIETEVRLAPGKAKLLYETAIKQFITNGVGSIPQWLNIGFGNVKQNGGMLSVGQARNTLKRSKTL